MGQREGGLDTAAPFATEEERNCTDLQNNETLHCCAAALLNVRGDLIHRRAQEVQETVQEVEVDGSLDGAAEVSMGDASPLLLLDRRHPPRDLVSEKEEEDRRRLRLHHPLKGLTRSNQSFGELLPHPPPPVFDLFAVRVCFVRSRQFLFYHLRLSVPLACCSCYCSGYYTPLLQLICRRPKLDISRPLPADDHQTKKVLLLLPLLLLAAAAVVAAAASPPPETDNFARNLLSRLFRRNVLPLPCPAVAREGWHDVRGVSWVS